MPSGAKKRKAAKKKKEQETHNGTSNPPPPQGSNDKNSQDKGVPRDTEAVQKVGIERELKDDSGSKDVVIEDAKSAKGSSNGDDRSSSSSSSDEESRVVDRRRREDAYASVSEEKNHNEDAPAGKTTSSASTESAPSVDSVKHEVSVTESPLDESAAISNDVVNAGLENSTETSLPIGDPVSKKTEDKSLPLLNDTAKASSSVVESASKENESKALPSLGTSLAQVSNDAEPIKDTEVPEYSEKQPLIAPPPPVAQKSSWLSCCGILDAIAGSG
ncbi:lisH domain-containing protein C1711.05-like [Pyrus communis]|uniref:lisH domain-containing protein C1711.05-like n=1 Tax=Pyrus communis TaxID=23211 RepID=UPI0035BECC57